MADQWTDRLSEYIDDELAPTERGALETHLGTCEDCRTALGQLRAVVQRAASLAQIPPARDLWPGIASRLEPHRPRVFRPAVWNSGHGWRVTFSLPQLAAAAVLLIAVSGGSMWMLQPTRRPAIEIVNAEPSRPPLAAVPILDVADVDESANTPYDTAVADLQRLLREGRSRLDPATLEVIEENLAVIDRAIRDARMALTQDPSDLYLNGHLVAARQRKLALLRQASALIDGGN